MDSIFETELSIIVPVYNMERYLTKCLSSLLSQSFSLFELIIVDDGSSDQSPSICDKFAQIDNRVIVIHQENKGVSMARNAGLEIARGKYIAFIDADDWIEPDMYSILIRKIQTDHADVAICGANSYDDNYHFLREELKSEGKFNTAELQYDLFSSPSLLGGCVWNKLFRRECIGNLFFNNNLVNGEDREYLLRVYANCKLAVKIPNALYNMYLRENSSSRTVSITVIKEGIKGRKQLIKEAGKFSFDLEVKAMNRYIDDCFRVYLPLLKEHINSDRFHFLTYYLLLKNSLLIDIVSARIHSMITAQKMYSYLLTWIHL